MKRNPARRAALLAAALVVLSSSALPSFGARPAAASLAPGHLSGVVRDETGAVLAGAEVRLSTPGGPVAARSIADTAGRYSISVATGLYDMTVVADDDIGPWTAHVRNMSVWSDTPLDFAVVRPADDTTAPDGDPPVDDAPGGTLDDGPPPDAPDVTWTGRIQSLEGDPIEPREFSLEAAGGGPGGNVDTGGSDGSFTFTGPAGRYDLSLATGLHPWDGGDQSGADDGLFLTGTVDLTADRSDDLRLPNGGPVDVVVAAIDGRKRSDLLSFSAAGTAPVELAPGVVATAAVHDTVGADDNAHYEPLLFGPSAVTITVPGEPTPVAVTAPLEPGDRLAIVIGDRRTPPSAPRGVTVTAGDGRVKATWKTPASDGGSPITGYTITASSGGSNYKASYGASETSGSVRNLIDGTEYTVTVTARNTKGGTASAPVTVRLGADDPVPGGSNGTGGDDEPAGDPVGGAGAGGPSPETTPSGEPRSGYWLLGSDGAVHSFGDAEPLGDAAAVLAAAAPVGGLPVRAVDLEPTPSGAGYWLLDSRGLVHPFGDAGHFGDAGPVLEGAAGLTAGEAAASLSGTPTGAGYWVFTNRGRAIAFGDAAFLGDLTGTVLNGPVLDSVGTATGGGYFMVAADGGIFAFGDARFAGSMGGRPLNARVRSLVPDGDGNGYWLVAADGGVFAFDAPFRGSMGGRPLNRPVRGMVRYGDGYVMVAEDGGTFAFSDRTFGGSLGGRPPAGPIVAVGSRG